MTLRSKVRNNSAAVCSDIPSFYPRRSLIAEEDVQRLWSAGFFSGRRLLCEDGTSARIEFPGFPNREAGPDFTEARIRMGQELRVGDVEIHLTSRGWHGHHHDEDSRYRNVILHVALWRDHDAPFREVRRPEGSSGMIPELVLETALDVSLVDLKRRALRSAEYPPEETPDFFAKLETLGRARYAHKRDYFTRLLATLSADEVLYRGLMTSMGYKRNKASFYELARIAPFAEIQRQARSATDPCEVIEKQILSAAGLDHAGIGMDPFCWRTALLRPANHPIRRIFAMVPVLAGMLDGGLVKMFEDILIGEYRDRLDRGSCRRVWKAMAVPLRLPQADKRYGMLGLERIDQILANVVLPFFSATWGRPPHDDPARKNFTDRLYETHPALKDHAASRTMLRQFHLDPSALRTVPQQMGLTQLYRTGQDSVPPVG